MSSRPRLSPSSRWSLGSKSNVGISPIRSISTKSSSPPAGVPSSTTLESSRWMRSTSAAAVFSASSASLTACFRAPAASSSAGRSSGAACPTFLPWAFCSPRAVSAAAIEDRRASSADSSWSTRDGSSPRVRWESRTTSGFSRSSLRSITGPSLAAPSDHPDPLPRLAIRYSYRRSGCAHGVADRLQGGGEADQTPKSSRKASFSNMRAVSMAVGVPPCGSAPASKRMRTTSP